MSIFGKLRRAKQAADDQKDKKAAAADPKPKPAPYRHVPTHAATDALLGAPATWREEDKKAIQAQHQKRSQHNLTRNPSSLSNVTTLNRDQSFTSKDFIHSVTDQRRRYSRDWTSNTNVPRKGQLTSVASTTNSSMRSQFSPTEHSFGRSSMRRSRFDTAELAPPAENDTEPRAARPYSNAASPSKDVKFYLPSSRGELHHDWQSNAHQADYNVTGISPSHSSEGSASSSPDSSCQCQFLQLVNGRLTTNF